eukprot:scaffold83816_cov47-Attheya_sp.AAC.1
MLLVQLEYRQQQVRPRWTLWYVIVWPRLFPVDNLEASAANFEDLVLGRRSCAIGEKSMFALIEGKKVNNRDEVSRGRELDV